MVNKILVTGAAGYIGARLCSFLADQGYKIVALCHSKRALSVNWETKMEEIVYGDIRDRELLENLATKNFDAVIHLVSLDHAKSNLNPDFVTSINVTPVWNLLDIFSKRNLKKFIYFSTSQVYGKLSDEVISVQTHLATPCNAYGLTHAMGEQICDFYNRNSQTQCKIIRLSNSYGSPILEDANCWDLVINSFCKQIHKEGKITIQSDGTPIKDFIHGWDVCQAINLILQSNDARSYYNICSGISITITQLAQLTLQIYQTRYQKQAQIIYAAGKNTPPASRYQLDIDDLKSLHYQSQWTLNQGINEIFDYLDIH